MWALWHHFNLFRDIEFIKPLYRPLIIRAANWICEYRNPTTGLPHPSYDLWEERLGVHAWTLGAVYGGLTGAANMARVFGEIDLAEKYETCAQEIRAATDRFLWHEPQNRFVRTLYPSKEGVPMPDARLDASLVGLYRFGMYSPRDPRITATLQAVYDRLWVKTPVGGIARYEDDYYHQVSQDIENVPGNPWFVCAAWLAQWHTAAAENKDEIEPARKLLEWIAARALPSGVLAEQVNPYTDCPLSVSPLTWSHAEYVIAFLQYVDKLSNLDICQNCQQPIHPRRQRMVE